MLIYFSTSDHVKRTAKLLRKKVREWGDEMAYTAALVTVSRMFGYDDHADLVRNCGANAPSLPDKLVEPAEASARYQQYFQELTSGDFSEEEAKEVLKMRIGPWWGFEDEKIAFDPPVKTFQIALSVADISPASTRVILPSTRILQHFVSVLSSVIAKDEKIWSWRYQMVAKAFGHQTYDDCAAACNGSRPSSPDWLVGQGELEGQAFEYSRVFQDFGLDQRRIHRVLRDGYCEGWWGLEQAWELGANAFSGEDRGRERRWRLASG